MYATLTERDGKIAIETPRGIFVFDAVVANHLGYAMQECSRWLCAKESDDPDRQRRTSFVLRAIIDHPVSELGGSVSETRKGSEPLSSAGGISGPPATGEEQP